MSIQFACPSCSQLFNGSDDLIGQKVHCTKCDQRILVPKLTRLPSQEINVALVEDKTRCYECGKVVAVKDSYRREVGTSFVVGVLQGNGAFGSQQLSRVDLCRDCAISHDTSLRRQAILAAAIIVMIFAPVAGFFLYAITR